MPLNIIEEKTGKPRTFNITFDTQSAIEQYCEEFEIGNNDLLFKVTERAIQKQLKIVCDHLKLKNVSTHSFRKFCGMRMFVNSGYNFEVVRRFYQHSSFAVTQRYLGITDQELNNAIEGNNNWL